jgi:hypothetical protein
MVDDVEGFCLLTYVIVNEISRQLEPLFRRLGPHLPCSDSELLTVIDRLPIPVLQFHVLPSSLATHLRLRAASAGHPRRQHPGIRARSGQRPDLPVGVELLKTHGDLAVLGHMAYISAPLAEQLRRERGIQLLTVPRKYQRQQLPSRSPAYSTRLIFRTPQEG